MNSDKLEISSDEHLKSKDNSEIALYASNIPETCQSEKYPCVLGIDVVGKGIVSGPVVYAVAFCPIIKVDVIASLINCAELTKIEHNETFNNIFKETKSVGCAVNVISANLSFNPLLDRKKYPLNQVLLDPVVGLIRAMILEEVNIAHIYVDAMKKAEIYEDHVRSLFPSYNITVVKKADSLDPAYSIVSAANICAKVTRDHALELWKEDVGFQVLQEHITELIE